jgi:anti-sigma B factor antagonist
MATTQYELDFKVTVEDARDPSVVRVKGDLDSFSAGALGDAFGRVVGCRGTVVDMRGVPFLDSSGLGALVGGIRSAREAGGAVVLCCTSRSVLRLLSITGVDRVVTVTSDPAEAEAVILAARRPTAES